MRRSLDITEVNRLTDDVNDENNLIISIHTPQPNLRKKPCYWIENIAIRVAWVIMKWDKREIFFVFQDKVRQFSKIGFITPWIGFVWIFMYNFQKSLSIETNKTVFSFHIHWRVPDGSESDGTYKPMKILMPKWLGRLKKFRNIMKF